MGDETYISNYGFSSTLIRNIMPASSGSMAIYGPEDYLKQVILAQDKNTYIETISGDGLPSADMFHIKIKENATIEILRDLLRNNAVTTIKSICGNQKVIVLFDESTEPYYGWHGAENAYIQGYAPEKGSTGSYKFLCCHILLPDGQKIYVDCVPMSVLSQTANAVGSMLRFLIAHGIKILFCLFDRGYYSHDVIEVLGKYRTKYLMLVPKTEGIKKVLEENLDTMFIVKGYMVADKARTDIIVIRDERFDWTFATNLRFKELPNAIRTYKMRWNIETGFRVTDEARVKSKSTNIVIRYFLFLCSFIMYNFWKTKYFIEKISFKRMISKFSDMIIGEKYFWKGYMYAMSMMHLHDDS